MVPTNSRAASRGSWVSVSSVMTYFTLAQDRRRRRRSARSGPVAPPRSSAFRSPACRACARSPSRCVPAAFQRRGRWNRKKGRRLPRIAPVLLVECSIRCCARRSSGSSSGSVSSRRVAKIGQQAEVQAASRLARKRTSSASTRSSIAAALVSMVGTTTSVRDRAECPRRNPSAAAAAASPAGSPASSPAPPPAGWCPAARATTATSDQQASHAARRRSAWRSRPPARKRGQQRDGAQIEQQREARTPACAALSAEERRTSRPRAPAAADPCRSGSSRRARARSSASPCAPRAAPSCASWIALRATSPSARRLFFAIFSIACR